MTLEQENKLKRLNYRPEEAGDLMRELRRVLGAPKSMFADDRLAMMLADMDEEGVGWLRTFVAVRRAHDALNDVARALMIPCDGFLTRVREIFNGVAR